jgi:hypothetical protein
VDGAKGDFFAASVDGHSYDKSKCICGFNSYPILMQHDPKSPGRSPERSLVSTLKTCTSDKTLHMWDTKNPNYQLSAVDSGTDFVTLSIRGNGILLKCVYRIVLTCDGVLDTAREVPYRRDFYEECNMDIIGIFVKRTRRCNDVFPKDKPST